MIKQTLYRISMVSLIMLVGALSASAQSRNEELTVKVPFDFNVGKKVLPAGNYVIRRSFQTPNLLTIQREDGSVVVTIYASPIRMTQRQGNYLTFNKYGGEMFLARVQSRSGSFSHQLIKTKLEREQAQISAQ